MKTINESTKLAIATAAIKHPNMTVAKLAEKYDVSETSVRRAKQNYTAQAKLAMEQTKQKVAKVSKATPGKKGWQGKTGRIVLVRKAVAKMINGNLTKQKAVEQIQKQSDKLGIRHVSNSSIGAMVSQVYKGTLEGR